MLRLSWPGLQGIPQQELDRPLVLTGEAGRFTLYPPPPTLPRSPVANASPVVLWEQPGGRRVLYIGDASMATVQALPPAAQRADIVILGRNPKRPMEDLVWLRACGAKYIILLPSAAEAPLPPARLAPARLIPMEDGGYIDLGSLH